MTATTVGQMTLFAGGLTKEGSNEVLSSTVDIYNQDTNQWLTSRLPQVDGAFQDLRAPISAVRTGKKVLFAGDGSNHVDIYNTEFINTPPTTTGIHNQTVLIGQSINIDLASAFSDAQTPSSLSLSTSGLPLGLGLINTTITGVPATTGTTSITVTAADPGGLSVNTSFSLTVQASGQNTSLSLLVPTYDCQTGAFRFNTIGGDGSPIEYYAVPGITGWTTNPNQFVDAETRTAADAQPITLKARQNGQEVMLVRDIRAVCPVSSAPFAITGVNTMSCQAITATERRLTFTPQYRGLTSEPFSFSVVNEMLPTSAAGPYNLRLYTDNPIITLKAQQGNLVASYSYNWLAVCSSPARSGSGEVTTGLAIKVLGNPVTGQTAEVEISGVTDQSVQINLADMQGKSVHTQRIEQAGAVERVSLSLGASNGVLLLQVSTPTQCQQVKLLRTN
ncbi:putative Ig domain-containing protein [Spirosoma agri]|nr:putative Ig domain-containing protein [Spirosoma agri]